MLHFPLDQDLLVSLNAYKPQIELVILPTDCQKWLREFGRRALFDQSISIKLEECWNGTEEKCDEDICQGKASFLTPGEPNSWTVM